MNKKVLGKGLGAIISTSTAPVDEFEKSITEERDRIIELPIDKIKPNPHQPRTDFDEYLIENLAESIKTVGLIQPIIVRNKGDIYYIVAGERRLRASKLAGIETIKSIIIKVNEEENLTLALIENLQREDLNPIEEAKAYKVLINRFKLKQHDIAQRVNRDRATIANIIRLLNLPEEIQQGISEGKISIGHAKILLSVPGNKKQIALFNEIILKNLSVRALEKIAESQKEDKDIQEIRLRNKDPQIKKMEEKLISLLGTKVEIKHSGNKGKIEINYYSLDDFERIIELFN